MSVTGKFSFRRSFRGRIVLQVEEEVKTFWPFSRKSPMRRRFRDATLMDLAAPELRALIDLRHKPHFAALSPYYYPPRAAPLAVADASEDAPTALHLPPGTQGRTVSH